MKRNEICIRLEMREALLDMRTFKYSGLPDDKRRYTKALRKYNKLCKEIDA